MTNELKGCDAAHFLLGYYAAVVQSGRKPSKRLTIQACEARDVIRGGSFRGPLAVMDMEDYAQLLAENAAVKACSGKAVKP